MNKGKIAVLLSGRGSNFIAIHESSLKPDSNFEVAVVISDQPDARGLQMAREFHYPSHGVPPADFSSRAEYETRLVSILKEKSVDLVCLAGYMRIVGKVLLREYRNRIMNIHPALLPAFPGLHAQKQALDHGVKVSGCTVHFVDSGMDTGPIILQRAVEVREGDDEERLSMRILEEEHRLFSRAIRLFFDSRLKIRGRRVIIEGK
jgi:phosphoribosylglycinamide formyltransferase-1